MADQHYLEEIKEEKFKNVSTHLSNSSPNNNGRESSHTELNEIAGENKFLQKEVEMKEKEMRDNIVPDIEMEAHDRAKQLFDHLTRTHCYAKHLADRMREVEKIENKVLPCSSLDTSYLEPMISCNNSFSGSDKETKVFNDTFDQSDMKSVKNMQENRLHNPLKVENTSCSTNPSLKLPLFEGPCLKDYQIKGLLWLKRLYENAINGILADEMGLGKTAQVIALICHLINKKILGPYLIIVPLSTVLSWLDEFEKFAPKIPTILFHGSATKRNEIVANFTKASLPDGVQMYPIVITTYEIPLREKLFFLRYNWEYIIVDEGQRLKNYRCQLSKFLKEISSKNRLLLTGTPLQNNLVELWALLNFLMPEVFNDLSVFERWLSAEELHESQRIVEKEAQDKLVSTMHQILSPFILRRMKRDVEINLPPKKEVLIYAPMSQLQWELYTATMNRDISCYFGREIDDKDLSLTKRHCSQNVRYTELSDNDDNDFDFDCNTHIRSDISNTSKRLFIQDKEGNLCKLYLKMQNPAFQLRKISNHPYLVQMPVDSDCKGILINENIVKKSGKMLVLDVLLPRLKADNHKVLLFSTMTMLLDIIEEYIIMRTYSYIRLDGEVCLKERSRRIKEFSTDPSVFLFLMSTRAGGLGLNLTSADTVIIFDSDWNPQVDLQAQDRCHRIGQTKPVVVYRLITQGTIDEKIVNEAASKIKLGKVTLHKCLNNMKDLSDMERTISLQELRELLESKGNMKIIHTSGSVLQEKELDEILDRTESTFVKHCQN